MPIVTYLSEEQLIKINTTNILICTLTFGKNKGKIEPKLATKDNKDKVLIIEESKDKRCSFLSLDGYVPSSPY